MADVTGALHHEFAGKSYVLRLTMGGLARLQDRHGNDLAGLLSGKFDAVEGQPKLIPPFAVMLDVLSVALQKGEGLDQQSADDLADEMLTLDRELCGRVMQAAFPDTRANAGATAGKGEAAGGATT